MKSRLTSNITDEYLLNFKQLSLKKKLRFLEEMHAFRQKFVPLKKLLLWEKIKRGELKTK